MGNEENVPRVLSGLVVPPSGSLEATGNPFEPYRLVDGAGETIRPAAAFFAELAACGRPATTLRSYDGLFALVSIPVGPRAGVGSGNPGRSA
jgi:hypothetical protein